jgi:cellulase/cellobiase CelA1
MAEAKYRPLRIINVIEGDSLPPNLVTNTSVPKCVEMRDNGGYVEGIAYALAQLGALPNPYVWIKPPGESDGASQEIPNEDGKGSIARAIRPTRGNERNGNSTTGALAGAPLSGAWFSAQFQELMQNAHPAL